MINRIGSIASTTERFVLLSVLMSVSILPALVAGGYWMVYGVTMAVRSQESFDRPCTPLFDGVEINQVIRLTSIEEIEAVSLLFGTYNRINQGTLRIELIDGELSGARTPAFAYDLDVSQLKDNQWRRFELDRAESMISGILSIRVTSEGIGPSNAVTLWIDSRGQYPDDVLREGQTVIPGSLAYKLWARRDAGTMIGIASSQNGLVNLIGSGSVLALLMFAIAGFAVAIFTSFKVILR